jgi:hypothetical protein
MMYGQIEHFQCFEVGGIYSNHWALNSAELEEKLLQRILQCKTNGCNKDTERALGLTAPYLKIPDDDFLITERLYCGMKQ